MQRGGDKSVTKITVSSLLLRLFHRNRSREQDVVFQVKVLMQIRLEFSAPMPI